MTATAVAQGNDQKPKNLQVLPKDLTRRQVVQIMRGWAGALGAGCDTCHAEYPDHRKNARGRTELDFPSDAKPQKRMARIMYRMVQADRNDYLAKAEAVEKSGGESAEMAPAAPLTCGTCHRGHLRPEAYIPPKREERRPGAGRPGF